MGEGGRGRGRGRKRERIIYDTKNCIRKGGKGELGQQVSLRG